MKEISYFNLRGVDPSFYHNFVLPIWINDILSDLSKNISILDYGCGYGQFLQALQNEGYNNTKGLDLDADAVSFCRQNNFDVTDISQTNLIDYVNDNTNKFDLIILSHVLEHVPKSEMVDVLQGIYNLLKTDGQLLIAVPNGQASTGSYWMWEDFTHHWLFTSGSLKYVLVKSGFDQIKFVDIDCTAGMKSYRKLLKKLFIKIFVKFKYFINRVYSSPFHKPSLDIFSFEIKAVAKK